MSLISFSGLSSGLDTDAMIEAIIASERTTVDLMYKKVSAYQEQQTALDTVESSFTTLKSSLKSLTDSDILAKSDLFNKKTATSSDTDIATATATNKASAQTIKVKIDQLATSTTAKTANGLASYINGSEKVTSLADSQGTEGVFSLYVNGVRHEVEVGDVDDEIDDDKELNTVNQVLAAMEEIDGVEDASIVDGKLQLTFSEDVSSVTFGSINDTSNFWNVTNMSSADTSDLSESSIISSTKTINKLSTGGTIVGSSPTSGINASTPITTGTFTVGQDTFTIDDDTTLSDIMNMVNSSDEAGVTMSIDPLTQKLVITADDPGAKPITLQDGDDDDTTANSNFLSAIGFITSTGDSTSCQTLGKNAIVYLNDSTVATESSSNKLTGDVTGMTGVTINLNKYDAEDNEVTIKVAQDTDSLTSAINTFITNYNSVMSTIEENTGSDASLHSEYSLVSLKNSIRSMTSGVVSGLSTYTNFSAIGISTGSAGKSVSDVSSSLVLDKDAFLEALQENPSEVKALLIGDEDKGVTGVLSTLEDKLESLLDKYDGYFTSKDESIESSITSLNSSIERGEDRLTKREETLKQQFANMEQTISQLQQSSSAISSL